MERLQKILARAGIASRRKCEELILAGRVTVDGTVMRELGCKADPDANVVRCDGEIVRPETALHVLLNKPRGFVCSNTREGGHPRVIDLVGAAQQRLFTVGRLDVDSEGLVIATNDGDLANRLAHPRYGVSKTYIVDVSSTITSDDIAKLRKGVHLAEGMVRFDEVHVGALGRGGSRVRIVIRHGLNREIRRVFAALGHKVRRLRRIAIGSVSDDDLKPGAHRKLTPGELKRLQTEAAGSNNENKSKIKKKR